MIVIPPGFEHIDQYTVHLVRIPGINPSGYRIALLHGIAATASSWLLLMRHLLPIAKEFIVLDMPAHGLSPAPNPPFTCLDAYRCVEKSLLQMLDPESKNLIIGNSLGGAFALKFAMDNPDYIQKCVLISPAGTAFPRSAREVIEPFCKTKLTDSLRIIEKVFVKPTFKARMLAPAVHRTVNQPAFQSMMNSIMEIDENPSCALSKIMFTPQNLQKFSTPALLIWGDKDSILPHEMCDIFDQNLPKTTTRLFPPEYGHCPQFEAPKELAKQIRSWLKNNS